MKFYTSILILLLIINTSCEKWNYDKRDDHDFLTFELKIDINSDEKDDAGLGIIKLDDGGYAIVGNTINPVSDTKDMLLLVIDSIGDVEWYKSNHDWSQQTGEDDFEEQGLVLKQTIDSGFILAGIVEKNGNQQLYFVKTSSNGILEWHKDYGGPYKDECFSLLETSEFYMFSGSRRVSLSGTLIIKIDFSGENIKPYYRYYDFNTENNDYACSLIESHDGNFVALINSENDKGYYDSYLVKLRKENMDSVLFNVPAGSFCVKNISSVIQTNDGGFAIASSVKNSNNNDVRLAFTNSEGKDLRLKIYNNSNADEGVSFSQTKDNGFIILSSGLTLIKVDEAGEEEWRQYFEGISYGNSSVLQTDDGGYIFTGQKINTNTNSWEVYIVKTDLNGYVR